MAGRKKNLDAMKDAPAQEAPDFLGGMDAPEIERRPPMLPDPCPVHPLGVLGNQIVFLDGLQQIQIASPECRKGELMLFFGNDYLETYFESEGKERWDQRKAQVALISDCQAKGIFNPEGKVLGRGAHRPKADESALVLHMGRYVLIARPGQSIERHRAGMVRIGDREVFFPAADSLPEPASQATTRAEGEEVLELFGQWNWVDAAGPLLLLGFLGQAYIGGALDWRAHLWIPGPTASGKSSLQKRVRAMLAEWCVATSDATEAAIRQRLNNDNLAVSIDEAEAHDDPERLQRVLNLMKKSSSGDMVLRGSADHKGQEFRAQSPFLLSSVLHIPLRGEDRNRIVLLPLRELPENVEPLEMELAKWRSMGRRLHRRMIEQWPRFERTLAAYKRAIGAQRFEGRWQDTYGTLLACADIVLYDDAPDPLELNGSEPGMSRVNAAVATILPLLSKSRSEARTDVERVLLHLTSHILPGAHGMPGEPVGTWLARAMALVELDEPNAFPTDGATFGANDTARAKLKAHGLKVVRLVDKPIDPNDPRKGLKQGLADALCNEEGWASGYLAVAYGSNKGIAEIFARSDWAGGAWLQSLGKIVGAVAGKKVRFAGEKPDGALLVPLSAFRGDEG